MMITRVDKVTLWVARVTFALVTIILGYLLFQCGGAFVWDSLKNMPYLGLCLIGYIAAGWVSFSGNAPSFVAAEPRANAAAYKRMAVMLGIFATSAVVIAVWFWIAIR